MGRSAGLAWRSHIKAAALALPLLTLGACGESDEAAMGEKVAAAEAAAEKALAAQRAAEKAAAIAASARPAPVPEPTVVSDSPAFEGDGDAGDDFDRSDGGPPDSLFSFGEGQTVSPDGVVIPGQGV